MICIRRPKVWCPDRRKSATALVLNRSSYSPPLPLFSFRWKGRSQIPRRGPPAAFSVPAPSSCRPLPSTASLPGACERHPTPNSATEEDALQPRLRLRCVVPPSLTWVWLNFFFFFESSKRRNISTFTSEIPVFLEEIFQDEFIMGWKDHSICVWKANTVCIGLWCAIILLVQPTTVLSDMRKI